MLVSLQKCVKWQAVQVHSPWLWQKLDAVPVEVSLLFTDSTTSPQRFRLGVWPWWQVPDPSLPHLVPYLGGIMCTLDHQYRTTFHYNKTGWLYVPSSDIVLVSCLFACLQSSSTLWFNRTVANVVCEKSNIWFLSFQKKNMMGCAFVAEAWSICDVHCLISSSRANVWECVQVVGKLEITVSNPTTRHDLLLSNMTFIFIWDSLVLLSPLTFVLMRNIYSDK